MKGSYVDEEYKYIPTQAEALRQDSGSSVNKTQATPSNSPNSNLSSYPVRIVLPDVNIDIGVAKAITIALQRNGLLVGTKLIML